MTKLEKNFLRTPVWYPVLSAHTFLTSFVRLKPETIAALAAGVDTPNDDYPAVASIIEHLRQPMSVIPGNCFTSVDCCSPTDTERYLGKSGAVFSPESAWRYLAQSEKVQTAAQNGEVEYICLRPFRRMNRTREFRLFVVDGQLKAMSQYHLIRHFRRLVSLKDTFWTKAEKFVESIAWLLPLEKVVIDIYFTSSHQILILDLNPWGDPTDPLMLRTWERDWSEVSGINLIPAPTQLTGDVNVSF